LHNADKISNNSEKHDFLIFDRVGNILIKNGFIFKEIKLIKWLLSRKIQNKNQPGI
jgi:hypothetical protein